jgi:hypothetical protein
MTNPSPDYDVSDELEYRLDWYAWAYAASARRHTRPIWVHPRVNARR